MAEIESAKAYLLQVGNHLALISVCFSCFGVALSQNGMERRAGRKKCLPILDLALEAAIALAIAFIRMVIRLPTHMITDLNLFPASVFLLPSPIPPNPLPSLSNEKASSKSGLNLYDHLASVITNLLDERPDNAVDAFEEVSRQIKADQHVEETTMQSKADPSTQVVRLNPNPKPSTPQPSPHCSTLQYIALHC